MVHELAKDFDGKMRFEVKDWKKDDSPALIAKHGLKQHGMIITDAEGALLWKESGHKQQREKVAEAIRGLLAN